MSTPIQAIQQQRLLLQLEYNTEKEAFRQQTEAVGLLRLVRRGDAWWPLRVGRSYYNALNQRILEVYRTTDTDIEHNFEPGRPLAFLTVGEDGKLRYFHLSATVSYVDGDRLLCVVPDNAPLLDLQNTDSLAVQLSFDETSYRTMMDALDRLLRAKGRLAYLRDLFYTPPAKSGKGRAETFTFAPMRFPYLNAAQEQAVNQVLRAKDVAIVHGPPGTGKTTTLVEAIRETLMRESQVLVCAQSNMAVDWICEKLVDRGISVLRIGNPSRVNDKMLAFTYERRFEAHPDYPQLWAIRKAIRELRTHRGGGRRLTDGLHQKLDSLKSRATELELRINNELFGEARVIASTLVGSSSRLLEGQKFGTLFIDEAAQALEAACWIPLRRVSRVVLAGDHCQLPPTVMSIAALKAGLGVTLMERIVDTHPEAVTLLRIQYRMNDDIMRFSSDYFYGGQVESAPEVKFRGILDLDVAMEWLSPEDQEDQETQGNPGNSSNLSPPYREEFVGGTFGRINKAEARRTLDTLEAYFNRIGRQRLLDERIDVGIISPYRAQVQLLRQMLKQREGLKPFRRQISVNTVDGFQGQERDIIIISLVRANDDGQIGFLRDLRRMNVAITRARMKVIILGDRQTLARHPFYRQLWHYVTHLS